MAERNPPHNIQAEESLLGSMLLSRRATHEALEAGVLAGDFYKPIHAVIYEAMVSLDLRGVAIDPVTVADQLAHMGRLDDVGGGQYLLGLMNATPSASALNYAAIVRDVAMLRSMISAAADISQLAYDNPADVTQAIAEAQAIIGRVATTADTRLLHGYYDDAGMLGSGEGRDDIQPWIAKGVLRRHQRLLVVARAGIGKSTYLRQLAYCCENGVHPYTGQPTEKPRRTLVVELEAGEWDIASSLQAIGFALQRATLVASVFELSRPALLHRPGGLDIRSPLGLATLEAAIRRTQPELVVMGPVKYLSIAKPGENYEIAALALMGLLNELIERYDFALAMEVHFSRGDHGAPGGSERWVDWPDSGFGLHPPSDDITTRLPVGGEGAEMAVKQFRIPRDSDIWVPSTMIRGADGRLPWHVPDHSDPYRAMTTVYSSRYGGMSHDTYAANIQGEF